MYLRQSCGRSSRKERKKNKEDVVVFIFQKGQMNYKLSQGICIKQLESKKSNTVTSTNCGQLEITL